MNILRKYKLGKLMNTNYLDENEIELIEYIYDKMRGLKKFTHHKYNNYISLMNHENKILFKYRIDIKQLSIRKTDFMNIIFERYKIKDGRYICNLIESMVSSKINLDIYHTTKGLSINNDEMREIEESYIKRL